jgi:hypothetical protein
MGTRHRLCFGGALATVLLAAFAGVSLAAVTGMTRASTDAGGAQSNGASANPFMTRDGRYVVFQSAASNLVAGDTGNTDVFIKDLQTGEVERASVADDESQANGGSFNATCSEDGRYVAFQSNANNLVVGDTNGADDIFVRDRELGTTVVCSVGYAGAISNYGSQDPRISGNGQFVLFLSSSSNMQSGDTSRAWSIYVRDLVLGTTERASLADNEAWPNNATRNAVITPDGRYLAYQSSASNMVAGDTNNKQDIFVRDRLLGTTELVSVATSGALANDVSEKPSISDDGRFVSFHSYASNFSALNEGGNQHVFVRDRTAHTTELVDVANDGTTIGNGYGWFSAISGNGRWVAYRSDATNLITGDTNGQIDLFLRDTLLDTTQRVSQTTGGTGGTGGASQNPSLSTNGRWIAFDSAANNLVGSDTNGVADIFVATMSIPAPLAPSALTAAPGAAPAILLNWTDNSPDEDGFKIERRLAGGTFAEVAQVGADITSYTDEDPTLVSGNTYEYQVRAYNAGGDSPYSNIASATSTELAAPNGLTAMSVSSSRIDLNWNDTNTSETGTEIWRKVDAGSFGLLATVGADVTTYAHEGLSGNHTYVYHVRAINGGGASGNSDDATAWLMAAPTGTAASLAGDKVTVRWLDKSTAESGFEVWKSTNGGDFALRATVAANLRVYVDTAALEATHTYVVRAVKGANASSTSPPVSASPMAAPTALKAVVSAPTQVDLSWIDNTGFETGYTIDRQAGGAGAYVVLTTLAAGSTSYSDTTASANTAYIYRVYAVNAKGRSAWPAVKTNTTAPAAPSGVTATVNVTSATVKWIDNSTTENGFKVERSTDGGPFELVGTVGPNIKAFVQAGLTAEHDYAYQVRAYHGGGASAPGGPATVSPMLSPTTLRAVLSGGTVNLTWVDRTGKETGYKVERRKSTSTTWTLVATLGASSTSHADGGPLDAASTYYYRVRAFNATGNSANSNTATVTVP